MKKTGKGTPTPKAQFLHQGLTIYGIEARTDEDIAGIIRNRVSDFERTHPGYKFEKLIFGYEDPGKDQHFNLKFIWEP